MALGEPDPGRLLPRVTIYHHLLRPPQHFYKCTMEKVLLDATRGIILVLVKSKEAWFWALAELSLDGLDILPNKKIFESSQGTPVCTFDEWRLVLFHAQEPEPHHHALDAIVDQC